MEGVTLWRGSLYEGSHLRVKSGGLQEIEGHKDVETFICDNALLLCSWLIQPFTSLKNDLDKYSVVGVEHPWKVSLL